MTSGTKSSRKTDIIRASRPEAEDMTFKILFSLILAFVLAGCGQSGPLYVPGDPSSVEAKPQTTDDEDSEENGDEESP